MPLPAIVANITVPLLGLVDVAITGHLGNAAYIAAIAVGSMLFNVIYWVFGFLRMGTSGLTAQAYGRGDSAETMLLLMRGLCVALAVALAVLVLQRPLLAMAISVMGVEPSLQPLVRTYFQMRVGRSRHALPLRLHGVVHRPAEHAHNHDGEHRAEHCEHRGESHLVYGMGMKIDGVATGTLIAQWGGLLVAASYACLKHRGLLRSLSLRAVTRGEALMRFFNVNRDIFLRTLFLVAVNLFFVSAGATQGTVVLAVNTLLIQLFTLFSYVMDGFAYAGEALCGKYAGAGDRTGFHATVRRLFVWGAILTTAYTAVYALGGNTLPVAPHRRRSCACRRSPVSALGGGHTRGRHGCLRVGRRVHRHHLHTRHAPVLGGCRRALLRRLFCCRPCPPQPRPVAGLHLLSGCKGHRADLSL